MSMIITWLGHSCFKLESEGYSIVIDPYADDFVPGLKKLRTSANFVLCSHQHDDHNGTSSVSLVDENAPNPFSIRTMTTPHDDAGGTKRGMNKVHILEAGGVCAAHFGDIGCALEEEQFAEVGQLDVAMIPIGGYYTIGAREAKELADALGVRIIIPMHYRAKNFGFPNIGELSEYTRLCDDVVYYDGNSIEVDEKTKSQTAVFKYIP